MLLIQEANGLTTLPKEIYNIRILPDQLVLVKPAAVCS